MSRDHQSVGRVRKPSRHRMDHRGPWVAAWTVLILMWGVLTIMTPPATVLAQPGPDDEPVAEEPGPDAPGEEGPDSTDPEPDEGGPEDSTQPRKVGGEPGPEPVKAEPVVEEPVKEPIKVEPPEPVKAGVDTPKPKTQPVVRQPGQPNVVAVYQDSKGFKLLVDGKEFMVYGMNWTYIPIGENYAYSLWVQSDAFIKEALDYEMTLLKKMGINAIRQYDDIPPRWVTYIYEKYGIYTMVNNTVGRYGATIDGAFIYPTNYQDQRTRDALKEQVLASVNRYKNVPGVLMYLLGNENNYGLVWTSFEIENLPGDDDARYRARAEYLYSLLGEISDEIKTIDTTHPIALANGDLQFLDFIAKYCGSVDIMGSNVYRGVSSGDLYQRVMDELGKPFVYTEFGADAYNAREKREDPISQAYYLKGQWQEIYEQSYGKGKVGNSLGGFIFQWSDGWWKYGQSVNLDVQDTTASWVTAAYPNDFVEGQNNMNEEWFGICAKGPRDKRGFFPLYCRNAYYLLKDAFKLDPYAPTTTLATIKRYFDDLDPEDYGSRYVAEQGDLRLRLLERLRVSQLRLELYTFTTSNSDATGEGR
ncbi:MAG: glycoside hydrolase family 2 TIM barrel-domain containing protein, partial [Myxococcota bacterium]